MNEEELYKLAISDVPKYSLLNEILAIRDKRFLNENADYCINVNGYISLDVLNKYVKVIQENIQLKGVIETYEILIKANNINNWNELKEYINNRFYAIEFDYNNKIIDKFELVVRQNELLKLKEVIKNLEGKSE